MGAGQEARLEGLHAVRQRALEVERADDPVLGRAERQVDDRHGHECALRGPAAARRCGQARPGAGSQS